MERLLRISHGLARLLGPAVLHLRPDPGLVRLDEELIRRAGRQRLSRREDVDDAVISHDCL